jgi:hypothetical protein
VQLHQQQMCWQPQRPLRLLNKLLLQQQQWLSGTDVP